MNAEIATPTREFTQRLSATRRGARLARRLAVQQLDAWGIPYGCEPSDAVATVVAELAANAATHGRVPGRDFELRLMLGGAQVIRIEVTDTRTEKQPPSRGEVAAPPGDAEAGRGLMLVEALTLAWGVAGRPVGKTVWAEVLVAGAEQV
ncbi:ATP-binding protein [Streptomyces sp. NBC_01481]|uniref:ATP-binding protein n=1 Tax=Streptomyces sp. NBC_01481 TaxID=2975869 RepID=UPI00224FC22D|nr:ATP-binding protein [Streptomyces sp. NBC_01481]MCX4587029.1 ATP-binding protein [Streptomyces sp. NBC_01481]